MNVPYAMPPQRYSIEYITSCSENQKLEANLQAIVNAEESGDYANSLKKARNSYEKSLKMGLAHEECMKPNIVAIPNITSIVSVKRDHLDCK